VAPDRPFPAGAALRELPLTGPRTVVWLNEAQFYLGTPPGDSGEQVAAGLRELLRYPARAPMLATRRQARPAGCHERRTHLPSAPDLPPPGKARGRISQQRVMIPAAPATSRYSGTTIWGRHAMPQRPQDISAAVTRRLQIADYVPFFEWHVWSGWAAQDCLFCACPASASGGGGAG
jgi:hypothetical protein